MRCFGLAVITALLLGLSAGPAAAEGCINSGSLLNSAALLPWGCSVSGIHVGDEIKNSHLAVGTTVTKVYPETESVQPHLLLSNSAGGGFSSQTFTYRAKNCFEEPERAACGYPGPNSAGANCSGLSKVKGEPLFLAEGESAENENIEGWVVVSGANAHMKNDCTSSVTLENGATNFSIENSTVGGSNNEGGSVEEALANNFSNEGAVANNVKLQYCGECLHQLWKLTNSYVISNGFKKKTEEGVVHNEDWWNDQNTLVAEHDTLLNPSKQTAAIFSETGGSTCSEKETVTNSLIAGGGFTLYVCANSTSYSGASAEIHNDRFARKVCTKAKIEDVQKRGGYECSGSPSEEVSYFDAGEGTGAYFPGGGFFGSLIHDPASSPVSWTGSFWDDNLEAAE